MKYIIGLIIYFIISFTLTAKDTGPFSFEFEELADGVWAGVRADGPRFPVMGNVTFVISDEGVVVFDGGGMPAMSEQVIAKIKSLTTRPVTHVVTSHWHGDHNFGIFRFAEEYDDVTFIAHEFTREVFNSTRINYIDRELGYVEQNLAEFQKIVATGEDSQGNKRSEIDRQIYKQIIADGEMIDREFLRAKLTPPDIVFRDRFTIKSGNRDIELLHLGHGNTEGDIVMWLEKERIIATGDIVVLPSPYAFNAPPRSWIETLERIKALNYKALVPGHGPVQKNHDYVDLLIKSVTSIADQRDRLLADGVAHEEIEKTLDFSPFEEQFTGGDPYKTIFYNAWFTTPLRKAAIKVLSGERMVTPPPPISLDFTDEKWVIKANESQVVEHLGRPSLRLKGGTATVADLDLKNAMIEFDLAVTGERGFAGLMFRIQDDANYEHFYIRPHQSGKPDANQYTPVFNGVSGWQLYHGEDYATPQDYETNEWINIKVLYAGNKAQVFINSDEPVLHIQDLKRSDFNGSIGVNAANFVAVHFSNFKYTKLANAYQIPEATKPSPADNDDMITSWEISDSFAENLLTDKESFRRIMKQRQWQSLTSEDTGITNLARVAQRRNDANMVFAKYRFTSDSEQQYQLNFGYSDRAQVYVNGQLIYRGNNGYRSRDFRYLGTIGLFDSIVFTAQQGQNEIVLAVAEDFGGWGVMGELKH